jgi:methylmalonyl-CoA mutase C-terminal domain/subunit
MAVVLGGTIPLQDIPFLKENGIHEVFGPGTPLKKIVHYLSENISLEPSS